MESGAEKKATTRVEHRVVYSYGTLGNVSQKCSSVVERQTLFIHTFLPLTGSGMPHRVSASLHV